MSKSELACAYAALLLADDEVDVTADKISTIIKAANIKFVEPFMPGLFASALQGKNVKDMLANVGGGGAAPVAATTAAAADTTAAAAKPKEEEKKKVESEESDEDFNFGLFD